MSQQLTERVQAESRAPEAVRAELPSPTSINFRYKNRLQEFTQRSAIALPVYQTVNEGRQHEPRFRSAVLVDGEYYTSPNTFSNRKAAEQDAAKVAMDSITQKIRDEARSLIAEDTVLCKSILIEYSAKTTLERPTYQTIQSDTVIPVFVSSLVFNGVTYTGDAARNKKEAEQLAARAVILSILGNPDSGTLLSEIIRCKFRLYAALQKVKDPDNNRNSITQVPASEGTSIGYTTSEGKEVEVASGTINRPGATVSENCSAQQTQIPAVHHPFHEFKKPKLEPSPGKITPPIEFVPPVMGQPLGIGSSSAKKRKNKKKAKKKVQVDAQLPVAVVPLDQAAPCSVAQ